MIFQKPVDSEFILVDTESIQVSHVKNPKGTDITYSKCKIFKIISENDWEQSPFTHKRFFEKFFPQTFDYTDYKNTWFNTFFVRPSSHSWFFNWGEKSQKHFPNWFQEWWLFLELLKIFFVLKFTNLFITSKLTVKAFSLQKITIHFPSVLNLESLGFFVRISLPTISVTPQSRGSVDNPSTRGKPVSHVMRPIHE